MQFNCLKKTLTKTNDIFGENTTYCAIIMNLIDGPDSTSKSSAVPIDERGIGRQVGDFFGGGSDSMPSGS